LWLKGVVAEARSKADEELFSWEKNLAEKTEKIISRLVAGENNKLNAKVS
jgi:hypothetical protein